MELSLHPKDLRGETVNYLETYFPMNSEKDVARAIKYYRLVPHYEWTKFLAYLNRGIAEFAMTIHLQPNSELTKSIYNSTITADFYEDRFVDGFTMELSSLRTVLKSLSPKHRVLYDFLKMVEKKLNSTHVYFILDALKEWKDIVTSLNIEIFFEDTSIFERLVFIFSSMYKKYRRFMKRIQPHNDNPVLDNLVEDFSTKLYNMSIKENLELDMNLVSFICKSTPEEYHFCIISRLRQLQLSLKVDCNYEQQDVFNYCDMIESEILNLHSASQAVVNAPLVVNEASNLFELTNLTTVLEMQKNEQTSHLNIILSSNQINKSIVQESMQQVSPHFIDVLEQLEGKVYYNNIKKYNKNVYVPQEKQFMFEKLEPVKHVRTISTAEGLSVTVALVNEGVAVVTDAGLGKIKLFEISDGDEINQRLIENLVSYPTQFDYSVPARTHVLGCKNKMISTQSLTEGIVFDETGGFKLSFKPKIGYMDRYAENHRVLVSNYKNKNYSGMKTNLAYLFFMINEIEQKVIYAKKPVDSLIQMDAEKARMFAINDFKTYLKHVQKEEPMFNFTEYYETTDFGKKVFGFKKEEIVGLKRLFQTLIL